MILETGEVLFLPWERLLWVWLWLFHSLTLASLLETELSLWLFLFASAQRAGLHDGGGRMPQRRWVFHFPLVFTAPRFLWFAFQPSVIAFEFSKWFIFSLSIWGWFEIADLLLSDVETHLLKTYSFQMTPFLWSLLQFPWIEGSLPFYTFIVLLVGEGNGTPFQYSCLENPMDGGAW